MFVTKQGKRENPPIDLFTRKELVNIYNKGNPICVNFEINQRCAGGCLYCYASSLDSDNLKNDNLSFEKFKELLELKKIGVKVVYLYGGVLLSTNPSVPHHPLDYWRHLPAHPHGGDLLA